MSLFHYIFFSFNLIISMLKFLISCLLRPFSQGMNHWYCFCILNYLTCLIGSVSHILSMNFQLMIKMCRLKKNNQVLKKDHCCYTSCYSYAQVLHVVTWLQQLRTFLRSCYNCCNRFPLILEAGISFKLVSWRQILKVVTRFCSR